MIDQLDVESAVATNRIRKRMNEAQASLNLPVTPFPVRLPDGSDKPSE